jgi:hypothetical protein
MRFRARLVLGLYGVALAVPAVVMAGPLGDDESAPGAMEMAPPQAQAQPHHHKGLFGRRHCVECQRAHVKAHDGVDVPPPPALEPGMQGAVIRNDAHCPTCQGNMVVSGPALTQDAHAPGYAVVGETAGPEAPGYAVVGEALVGSEPVPVGISKMRTNGAMDPRMAAMGGRPGAGPVDPSVVPTSLPPPQSPLAAPTSNRPKIISHLFGLPMLGAHRREQEQKERDKHASIAYGQNQQPVTDLPTSVVYGKGSH